MLDNFIFQSKFYYRQKLYYDNHRRPFICKYLYVRIWRKTYLPSNQKQFCKYLCYVDDIFMVWIKSGSELRQFMNEINQKHQSIKFDFTFSKESIEFLDTLVYIDSKNRLQAIFYKKSTDCRNYLHSKSAHPFSPFFFFFLFHFLFILIKKQ